MPYRTTSVPWPRHGRSDDEGRGEQAPLTTRDAKNVRNRKPSDGKTQGSVRSGTEKNNTTQPSGANPVKHLETVVYDAQTIDYSTQAGALDKTVTSPGKRDCRRLVTDAFGNIWALEGESGVVVYNDNLIEVGRFTLPTKSETDRVIAIDVDAFGRFYAAVSETSDQSGARIWQYRRLPNDDFEQSWEMAPYDDETGIGYRDLLGPVIDLRVHDGLLYAVQNRADRFKSDLLVISSLQSTAPVIDTRREVPYPCNKLDVNPSGETITTHEKFDDRGKDPQAPNFTAKVVDGWKPTDLTDWEKRVHAWYDAADTSTLVGPNVRIEQGDEVFEWRDKSGNNRSLTVDPAQRSPIFDEFAAGGLPGVRFLGDDSDSKASVLVSGANFDGSANAIDQQLTPLPGHTDSQFCIVIALRPANRDDAGVVFHQPNTAAGANANDHSLYYNAKATGADPGTVSAGRLRWRTNVKAADPGQGPVDNPSDASTQPSDMPFDNDTEVAIVSIIMDGGVDYTTPGATTKTRSVVRVNGAPFDRFSNDAHETVQSSSAANKFFTMGNDRPGGSLNPYEGHILEMIVLREQESPANDLERILSHPIGPDDGLDAQDGETELELLEGYMAWKWGVSHLINGNTDYTIINPDSPTTTTTTGSKGHSFKDAPADSTGSASQKIANLISTKALLVKYGEGAREVRWSLADTSDAGGMGYSVAVSPKTSTNILALGPDSGDTLVLAEWDDQGDTVTTGASSHTFTSLTQSWKYPKIAIDTFGKVHVPTATAATNGAGAAAYSLRNEDVSSATSTYNFGSAGNNKPTYAVDLPKKLDEKGKVVLDVPDYGDDDIGRLEFGFLASGVAEYDGTEATDSVHAIKWVASAANGADPRVFVDLAVSNGTLYKQTSSSAWSSVSGGTLSTSARMVSTAYLDSKLYLTDGVADLVYDPKEDTLGEYQATSAGKLPPRCELMVAWGGRVVRARSHDNPSAWFASARGDGAGWDFSPPIQTPEQAIEGVNARALQVPDIINALVPMYDDLLLFGGDHSIWRLTGNPLAGGQLDLVSDEWGMAYGRPWCRSPDGLIYFFSSRGGLFAMNAAGAIVWVSESSVQRSLENIDLSTYRVELAYNWRDRGVHVFLLPTGAGGAARQHWFFEFDDQRLVPWEDEFGAVGLNPHSVWVRDADAFDDRILLLGCEDGYVRKWSASADDDDGTPIYSKCVLGPIVPDVSDLDWKFSHLRAILSGEQGGAFWRGYGTDDPGDLGNAAASGTFGPGANPPSMSKFRGAYGFVELSANDASTRWALESLEVRYASAGPRKVMH